MLIHSIAAERLINVYKNGPSARVKKKTRPEAADRVDPTFNPGGLTTQPAKAPVTAGDQ